MVKKKPSNFQTKKICIINLQAMIDLQLSLQCCDTSRHTVLKEKAQYHKQFSKISGSGLINVSLLLSHHPNPHPSGELLYPFGCDWESSWSPTLLLHTLCFIHCRCRDQAARFTLLYIALFKTVFLNVLDGFMCVCLFFCTFPFMDDSLRLNVQTCLLPQKNIYTNHDLLHCF